METRSLNERLEKLVKEQREMTATLADVLKEIKKRRASSSGGMEFHGGDGNGSEHENDEGEKHSEESNKGVLQLPSFDGTDPIGWVDRANQQFEIVETPLEAKAAAPPSAVNSSTAANAAVRCCRRRPLLFRRAAARRCSHRHRRATRSCGCPHRRCPHGAARRCRATLTRRTQPPQPPPNLTSRSLDLKSPNHCSWPGVCCGPGSWVVALNITGRAWHTCSICREFRRIKGQYGFCTDCLQLALLIEEGKDHDSDGVPVDFSDRDTTEGLFKEYYLIIKEKEGFEFGDLYAAKDGMKKKKKPGYSSEEYGEEAEENQSDFDGGEHSWNQEKNDFIGWGLRSLIEFLISIGKRTDEKLNELIRGKEMFMITADSDAETRESSMEIFNSSPEARVSFGSIKACGERIDIQNFKGQFPNFNLEDKVVSKGDGVDRKQNERLRKGLSPRSWTGLF